MAESVCIESANTLIGTPDEYLSLEMKERQDYDAAMERKRQEKAEWMRFSTEKPLLDTLMARTEGQCRLRDGHEGEYIIASDADDARRIAARMTTPMLSLITTKGEIIALTSRTANPDTATVSIAHGDTDTPLWVPVHPFPDNWIEKTNDA